MQIPKQAPLPLAHQLNVWVLNWTVLKHYAYSDMDAIVPMQKNKP